MKAKSKKIRIISCLIGLYAITGLSAQENKEKKDFSHSFSPQILARAEYRHGFQSLADTNAKYALFVGQRTRLTYKMSSEYFDIVIAPQDIRIWGSTSHLAVDNAAKLSLAEGYGVVKLPHHNKISIGRQIIQYDEHRIIGSLDWALQSRRHDLLLFQHNHDTVLSYHIGVAWNQDADNSNTTIYTLANHYKTLQFLWVYRKFSSASVSVLLLNHGFEFSKTQPSGIVDYYTVFNQTGGLNASASFVKNLTVSGWFYYQMGKDASSKITTDPDLSKIGDPKDIQAFDAAIDVNYKITSSFNASVGGEYLSGTSQDPTKQDKNYSFNPWYGTNHRFNGYMDYFYVGNHIKSVGLTDAYLKFNFSHKNFASGLNVHYFLAAADVKNTKVVSPSFVAMDKALGQEVDLTLMYKISDGVAIQAGYSQMFGTETLQALKKGSTDATSNWAYVMILFRPGTAWPKTGLKQ